MDAEKITVWRRLIMSRYRKVSKGINNLDIYKETLENRGVKKIKQYKTQRLKQFNKKSIPVYKHVWTIGDAFWKLANQYYGDPKYWYIIARFNKAPTEASLVLGATIEIPASLSIALQVVV